MKRIKLTSILIEGFGSFRDETFLKFSSKGIHFIKGENGAGKSSILNAIYFALYGKSLRGANISSIPTYEEYRDGNWLGTRVCLDFTINNVPYFIARHIDYKGESEGIKGYSNVYVMENGALISNDIDKSTINAYIANVLGVSHDIFLNTIMFGQGLPMLIDGGSAMLNNFISTIIDTGFIDLAKEKAKSKFQKVESLVHEKRGKLELNAELRKAKEEQLERDTKIIANFEKEKEKTINDLKIKLKNYKALLDTYTHELADVKYKLSELDLSEMRKYKKYYDKYTYKLNSANSAISTLRFQYESNEEKANIFEKQLNTLETALLNIQTECTICGAPLDSSQIDEAKAKLLTQIKAKKKSIEINKESNLSILNDIEESEGISKEAKRKIKVYTNKLAKFDDLLETRTSLITKKKELEIKIEGINNNIANCKKAIKAEKEKYIIIDLKDLKSKIDKYIKEGEKVSQKLLELEKNIEYLSFWKDKGFSNAGLRAYIINSMLSNINSYLIKYSSALGCKVELGINMTSARKGYEIIIHNLEGIKLDYKNLSGGEKKRIALAISYAAHDIYTSTIASFSVMFIDEAFEFLDEDGLYTALDLLREKTDKTAVYIMSHQNRVDVRNSTSINVYSRKGLSYIE